ncbi:hypothetical protein SMICM304S_04216 [Streptomyces microflavus]
MLGELPPAEHLAGWQAVLDGLHASTVEIRRILERPADSGSEDRRAQHAALWPHLTVWADHGYIASSLADQREGGHTRRVRWPKRNGRGGPRWPRRRSDAVRWS